MITEVNTRFLKKSDRLKVRVLRAKSKITEMGFLEVSKLFKEIYPNDYSKHQLYNLLYCKMTCIDFTTKLEELVDKLSQE
jgi:hypothetical protein